MKRKMFIEYLPSAYPENPYRVMWYDNPHDLLGVDLGGARTFEQALIIMRKIMIQYDHISPSEADAELRIIYGEVYEKALKQWKSKVISHE